MVALPENDNDDAQAYDPTPKEIRARARAIRKRWSERTRKRRRVTSDEQWSVPTIELTDVAAAAVYDPHSG